jgi:hypothetical protein
MVTILRLIIPLLAGLGAGSILDKFAADKLPSYPAEGIAAPITKDYNTGGIATSKIIWFVVAAVAGTLAVKFIGKKLNIKILK